MAQRIRVVKIGGNVVDDADALSQFLNDFQRVAGPKILVHGGGKEATRLTSKLGLTPKMIDGRRITDEEALKIVTMVYAGLINKRIVAALQAEGVDAIGLSGADANVVTASKRKVTNIDYGYVGDIDPMDVNESAISMLLKAGLTPVICAIMHDGNGQLLNCNADSVASAVAIAASRIAPTDLIYCFEKPGVLSDPEDDNSVIRLITPEIFQQLSDDKIISGGMLPKIDAAINALKSGISEVYIKNSKNLLEAQGTTISLV